MSKANLAKKQGRAVLPNQYWSDWVGSARVLAVAEGYAMLRRKGAVPFVVSVKELDESWEFGEKLRI